MIEPSAQIDGILAELPEAQRAALQTVRERIAQVVPEAIEGISYGVPAFRYRGKPLAGYSAAKAHCALYPFGPEVIDAHRAALDGFDLAKGTIRFTPERPLPPELLDAIVLTRKGIIDRDAEGSPKAPRTRASGGPGPGA